MGHRAILAGLALCALMTGTSANAQSCRQALILGLDVSLSVDTFDYALQREGLAQALTDARVVDAMTRSPDQHIELAIFQWSSTYHQEILVDWTTIDGPDVLRHVSQQLLQNAQNDRTGRTAIGSAMLFAQKKLRERRHCANWTVDLSGDGPNNSGVLPETVQADLLADGITVNGLVIESDILSSGENDDIRLSDYYRVAVTVGPGAFVETIIGFDAYHEAIKRKLLREILPPVVRNRPVLRRIRLAARQSDTKHP